MGGAIRLFWLWFAANSSVLSLALGAVVLTLGMSLRQSFVAIAIGLGLSVIPLSLGTLAGKISGQPTMVTSRATFGTVGNILPALLAVISRVFWASALLVVLAITLGRVLAETKVFVGISERQLSVLVAGVGAVFALLISVFGAALIARMQLVLTITTAILVGGIIALSWSSVNLSVALGRAEGGGTAIVSGAVLVFSVVGLAWAQSSGDLARYQKRASSAGASMFLGSLGVVLPALVLVGYGALLAASNDSLARGLTKDPLTAIAGIVPSWFQFPLILAATLSLFSGVVIATYSGGFALRAVGIRLSRPASHIIVALLGLVASVGMVATVMTPIGLFRDIATTLAVPVAAWAGIYASDVLIRTRPFHAESLLGRGTVYPRVSFINLFMLLVASAVGWGLTNASVAWLGWEGYFFSELSSILTSTFDDTDIGVFVALGLGLITPLLFGARRVRRQEAAAAAAASPVA